VEPITGKERRMVYDAQITIQRYPDKPFVMCVTAPTVQEAERITRTGFNRQYPSEIITDIKIGNGKEDLKAH